MGLERWPFFPFLPSTFIRLCVGSVALCVMCGLLSLSLSLSLSSALLCSVCEVKSLSCHSSSVCPNLDSEGKREGEGDQKERERESAAKDRLNTHTAKIHPHFFHTPQSE